MKTPRGDWSTVGFSLTFGSLAGIFGFLVLWVLLVLVLAPDPFSQFRLSIIPLGVFNLATMLVSAYSVVRRLDSRPTARWVVASFGMATASVMTFILWSPFPPDFGF